MNKKFHLLAFLLLFLSPPLCIAQNTKPNLLKIPSDWKFERMDLPLDFAPELSFTGYEELRFAPGMFDTESNYYFTYLFALHITDKVEFSQADLVDFLEQYYRGLSKAVGESKKMNIDVSKIKINIEKEVNSQRYKSIVNFFDSFTDGREIVLNMELEVFENHQENSCYILALVSPHKKNSKVWKEMYQIRTNLNSKNLKIQQ